MGQITDVPGVKVGHYSDFENITGCTVIMFENSVIGSIDIRGGGTSTRQIDTLFSPHNIGGINAILLTGGSAYGLNAASGVMRFLEERGKGLKVPNGTIVPSVPTAVIFDLGIGNSNIRPTDEMSYQACLNADYDFKEGSVGAGTGATIGKYLGIKYSTKGGIASASFKQQSGIIIGVIVLVNSFGNIYNKHNKIIAGVRDPESDQFLDIASLIKKGVPQSTQSLHNTTICVISTDGEFSKDELLRIARIGSTGVARVINPCHTVSDGDIVFAVSCGTKTAKCNDTGIIASELISEAIIKTTKISKSLGDIPSSKDLPLKNKN
jgi:L-aminopeptidase/D-esterase-like protein